MHRLLGGFAGSQTSLEERQQHTMIIHEHALDGSGRSAGLAVVVRNITQMQFITS